MIQSTWKCLITELLLISVIVHSVRSQIRGGEGCPPQEAILPCRCLLRGDQFQIWCSHSDLPRVLDSLKAIGQYIIQPIDELILENNYLPALPGRTFLPLKVMRIMLRYNGLERVSSDWLAGLESSLMELFLVEPELRSLPEDSIVQLNELEAITIQSNLLKRLPLFFRLPKLRYIQVESHSLIELDPRNFIDLPSLEKFHVSGSKRLTRLESGTLEDLPRLKLVNITYCNINWIHPRAIFRLPVLRELSLIGNKISDAGIIGRGIRDLPNLEILRLDDNQVDSLGEASFVDLPALKKLYLSDNRITELHHGAFHRVPMLRRLDLNNNMLRRVHPESFLQHSGSGLEELWLVNNDISHVAELRSLLDALPRLTFLDMSNNRLEAIPFGALRGHPTLERLHLDYNKIHMIDREAFMAMPALRELRLRNNSLSDILQAPLWNLPSLKGLDLSQNYFRRIRPGLLANLPSLKKLDLSGNELTKIDPTVFLNTPELENINISYNGLSTLHPATFRHLLNLYELDASRNRLLEFVPGLPRGIENLHISHNQIKEIPLPPSPDLDLPSLRMLDLSYNVIQKIPPSVFKSLPQLRRLFIGRNSIQQIESNSLDGLNRLEILDVQSNRLSNIHPNALKGMIELIEFNLKNNRLDIIVPDLFKYTPRLKRLDISRNQIGEILPGTLDNTRELQLVDASYNALVQLPSSLFGMKKLKKLDLTNNRLKTINSETLNSLASLTELKVSQNFIQELKMGAFDNLQHLKVLHLDKNELEVIEPNAIRTLPVLKYLKLNQNRLSEIPSKAFNNLPLLEMIELQENQIRQIASDAFTAVPRLLMLNLSYNELPALENSGLRTLRSLEMLDLSGNKIGRVGNSNLDKMEWLVELRMDDNLICGVHGSPFDGMPRLRVLSMRNNKMTSFPERAVQKLRSNIAVLDIDGNPLVCSCNLLWLRGWLHENSVEGPHCLDGSLLREARLSRLDCPQDKQLTEPAAPGCEAELLSAPGLVYDTSQVFSQQWMNMKAAPNHSKIIGINKNNNIAPSPEESDYFYDEYIDYPYNDTVVLEPVNVLTNAGGVKEHKTGQSSTSTPAFTTKSSHYVTGDTPTIYAATKNKTRPKPDIPKEVMNSPSTSGFTFFGLPLPNINLNNLWGPNGRKQDNKSVQEKIVKNPTMTAAQRKVAIVNKPTRHQKGRIHMIPPSEPDVQVGGFIPVLPGSGGFKPIPNPLINREQNFEESQNSTQATNISPATSFPQFLNTASPTTSQPTFKTTIVKVERPTNEESTSFKTVIQVQSEENVSDDTKLAPQALNKLTSTTAPPEVTPEITTSGIENLTERSTSMKPELETTSNKDNFADLFQGVVDNVSVPTILTTSEVVTVPSNNQTSEASLDELIITTSTMEPKVEIIDESSIEMTSNSKDKPVVATPLSALLIPGGQQPVFKPAGRPMITKVASPHISATAPLSPHISATAPLQSNFEIAKISEPLVHHGREGKTALIHSDNAKSEVDEHDKDDNWYFANYNKSNLEPYVGSEKAAKSSSERNFSSFYSFAALLVLINYV